jgi:hypothetical protein
MGPERRWVRLVPALQSTVELKSNGFVPGVATSDAV